MFCTVHESRTFEKRAESKVKQKVNIRGYPGISPGCFVHCQYRNQSVSTPYTYEKQSVSVTLPLEWPNLTTFDVWHQNEELAHSIELIKSTITHDRQVWTLRCIFMCSHEDGRGGIKYVKKHSEQK